MTYSTWPTAFRIAFVAILGVSGAAVLSVGSRPGTAMPRTAPIRVAPAVAAVLPSARQEPALHLVARRRFGLRDGNYTGPTANAYYGWVKVQAIVRHGSLVAVHILRYPSDRATSRRIARYALPRLEREVIRSQSARVDTISGATLTSEAFLRSMRGALRQANG